MVGEFLCQSAYKTGIFFLQKDMMKKKVTYETLPLVFKTVGKDSLVEMQKRRENCDAVSRSHHQLRASYIEFIFNYTNKLHVVVYNCDAVSLSRH